MARWSQPGAGWAKKQRHSASLSIPSCPCCTALLLVSDEESEDEESEGVVFAVEKTTGAANAGAGTNLIDDITAFSLKDEYEFSSRLHIVDSHCHAHRLQDGTARGDSSNAIDGDKFNADDVVLSCSAVLAVSDCDWGPLEEFSRAKCRQRDKRKWRKARVALAAKEEKEKEEEEEEEEDRAVESNIEISTEGGGENKNRVWSIVNSKLNRGTTTVIVPGFGVHPWYVQDAQFGWEMRLAKLLSVHPGAIVGEVGLCKAAKNLRQISATKSTTNVGSSILTQDILGDANGQSGSSTSVIESSSSQLQTKADAWALQESFLAKQIALAGRFGRPVSCHCVKAFGPLLDLLERALYAATCGEFPPKHQAKWKQQQQRQKQKQKQRQRPVDVKGRVETPASCSPPSDGYPANGMESTEGLSDWEATLRASGGPPSIALHSFSGKAIHVAQFLDLEKRARQRAIDQRMELMEQNSDLTCSDTKARNEQSGTERGMRMPQREDGNDVHLTAASTNTAAATPAAELEAKRKRTTTAFYFGFSHTINVVMGVGGSESGSCVGADGGVEAIARERKQKKRWETLLAAVAAVPDDRILIESDLEDKRMSTTELLNAETPEIYGEIRVKGIDATQHDNSARIDALSMILDVVAEGKGWSRAKAAAMTSSNALRFLTNLAPRPSEDNLAKRPIRSQENQ